MCVWPKGKEACGTASQLQCYQQGTWPPVAAATVYLLPALLFCCCCVCRVDHSMTLIEKLIHQIERAVQVSTSVSQLVRRQLL